MTLDDLVEPSLVKGLVLLMSPLLGQRRSLVASLVTLAEHVGVDVFDMVIHDLRDSHLRGCVFLDTDSCLIGTLLLRIHFDLLFAIQGLALRLLDNGLSVDCLVTTLLLGAFVCVIHDLLCS